MMSPLLWTSLILSGCIASEAPIRQLSATATNIKATYTSCEKVQNTNSTRRCFAACLSRFTYFYSFSISKVTGCCYCCQNVPEVSCGSTYTPIVLSGSRHCWRFVGNLVNYLTAKSLCAGEGGNVIRVDSQEKQNTFQQFIVSHMSSASDVWIQAERKDTKWIYDDGTVLTYNNFAPPPHGDNGDPASNRARARAMVGFQWSDVKGIASFFVVCEMTL